MTSRDQLSNIIVKSNAQFGVLERLLRSLCDASTEFKAIVGEAVSIYDRLAGDITRLENVRTELEREHKNRMDQMQSDLEGLRRTRLDQIEKEIGMANQRLIELRLAAQALHDRFSVGPN